MYAIAIHGGAGTIRKTDMTTERDAAYRAGLAVALEAGHSVLQRGGSALDAVTAAVMVLEDNPLFNAGRGAVFTMDGTQELEASVMDGSTGLAGTVTGVKTVKNPVKLARRVMEATPHVTLGFAAADAFARDQGLDCVESDYFFTESRWQALQLEKARLAQGGAPQDAPEDRKHGTVGAVALDQAGHLAAATSTGGMTAKWAGRIGDTPIIGAGTWADARCAVSCTGHGESFIRAAAAHDIASRMIYGGQSLAEAADGLVHNILQGSGGVIAVDAQGHVAMPFNCEGMYRASLDGQGNRSLRIYREEDGSFSSPASEVTMP